MRRKKSIGAITCVYIYMERGGEGEGGREGGRERGGRVRRERAGNESKRQLERCGDRESNEEGRTEVKNNN
jgi:hypothetical protein